MSSVPQEPTLKKIDVTIARLRLLLADLSARESAQRNQRLTFLDQREKVLQFSLYGDGTLDNAMAMLADVEERVEQTEATLRSLTMVRERAERELEQLQITKGIEEARRLLNQLQARQAAGEDAEPLTGDEMQAEIARLQLMIHEASERAARTIEPRPS